MKLNRIKAVLEDKGISQTWLSKKVRKELQHSKFLCVQPLTAKSEHTF